MSLGRCLTTLRAVNGCKRLAQRQLRSGVAVCKIFDISKEEEFRTKVLEADRPVIVDFHANWCGPCKTLGPNLESAVTELGEKVDLAKVDVDILPELAMAHNVSSIPAVKAFVKGVKQAEFVGAQSKDFVTQFVKSVTST